MSIRLFVTGGTFDKEYNELDGSLVFQDSHVKEMLALGRCRMPVKVRTLMMVDSLEMSDAERQVILQNCRSCEEERIVVTHGTDTMEVTAGLLGAEIADKTVVLVGAMIPYTFGSSDGLFNLGAAVAFAQTLPHGVYVAMNGRVFPYDKVRKNRRIGEFEETD
ncbi:MAG: asparaginase [bacterium]|nr:asparaginase [bacterium]